MTMSFGGQAWAISSEDMNLGPVQKGSSMCIGAIFDLSLGADTGTGGPSWVIGDTFLVRVPFFRGYASTDILAEKRVLGVPPKSDLGWFCAAGLRRRR
jgi:hypothetical protein